MLTAAACAVTARALRRVGPMALANKVMYQITPDEPHVSVGRHCHISHFHTGDPASSSEPDLVRKLNFRSRRACWGDGLSVSFSFSVSFSSCHLSLATTSASASLPAQFLIAAAGIETSHTGNDLRHFTCTDLNRRIDMRHVIARLSSFIPLRSELR